LHPQLKLLEVRLGEREREREGESERGRERQRQREREIRTIFLTKNKNTV